MKRLNMIGIGITKLMLIMSMLAIYIILVMEVERYIQNFWSRLLFYSLSGFIGATWVIYILLRFPEEWPPFNSKKLSNMDRVITKLLLLVWPLVIYVLLILRVIRKVENIWLQLLFHAFSGFIVGGLVTYVLFKFPQPPSSNPKNSLNMKKDKESESSLDTDQ